LTASSETIKPLYVLDTSALIWYLKQDKKLSARAAAVFQAAERGETRLIISAIVIAELFYADKKHGLFESFGQAYADLRAKPYFRIVPFFADDVLDFERDAAVPEMHDRIIAGLARRFGAPLITSDPQIEAANLVEVMW
jgi:predicted nucleic acid-binding protein